jgi:hypothetical protein
VHLNQARYSQDRQPRLGQQLEHQQHLLQGYLRQQHDQP